MNKKSLYPLVATVVTAVGIMAGGTPALADAATPRGMNVLPQAVGCRIGTFPQVTKAGQYNVLCEVMQDNEKCLAFIKGHFRTVGETVSVRPTPNKEKLQYCLEVLQHDLGIGAE